MMETTRNLEGKHGKCVCYLRTQVLELSNLMYKPKATDHYVILVLPSQYLSFPLLKWGQKYQ